MNYSTVTFALVQPETLEILAFNDFPDYGHAKVWADNHICAGEGILLELDLMPGECPNVGDRVFGLSAQLA